MLVKDKVAAIFGVCDRLRRGACYGARGRESTSARVIGRSWIGWRVKLAAGGRAETFIVDLLDERSTAERIAQLTQQSGGLDIVVNATGFVHNQGKEITTLSLAEFMQGITPFRRPSSTRRKPLPHMGGARPGVIITVVAPAATMAMPGHRPYRRLCG